MAYVKNRGVKIHYETIGEGLPLVLLNGGTQSSLDWHDVGYVDKLKNDYQLILIDMRGSGKSDKFYDAAQYDYETRATDVIAVLDELKIQKAVFLGFSQGGWVGYPLAGNFPERILALILIGAEPQFSQREKIHPTPDDAKKMIETFIHSAVQQPAGFYKAKQLKRWADSDLLAFAAAEAGNKPSFMHYLAKISMPCLLLVGGNDPNYPLVKEASLLIQDSQIISLVDMDHLASFLRSDLVVPIVVDFLELCVETV